MILRLFANFYQFFQFRLYFYFSQTGTGLRSTPRNLQSAGLCESGRELITAEARYVSGLARVSVCVSWRKTQNAKRPPALKCGV